MWVGDAIGNTPAVTLNNIDTSPGKVLIKLEYVNPGGSIKDRAALFMILEAEKKGILKKGMTIVEPSSGNTALSLAMLAAARGYNMVAVVPKTTSWQKVKTLKLLGAEVVFAEPGVPLGHPEHHYTKAKRLAEERGWVMLDQYRNEANIKAHYETTGPEIWRQANEIMGGLDAFVAGVGTGGTILGVGRYLKERDPRIKVIAIVPKNTKIAQFFGLDGERLKHDIEGLTAMPVSELIKKYHHKIIDEIVEVEDPHAFDFARELARKEGLLVGLSAGANALIATKLARERGWKVATVAPDGAIRYLDRL
ncbi:cysteine synthase [Ignicoccus pacificus DSM 13166]|uniref:Cysteine synthase n=1 Tax=Ignicoccus pacificus DSM 13166 TaxID=940294 RepID=A0A977K9Y0_9CREN|nr:cysteine synthase [Ignicoccus pacificus DSM 13166]